MPLGGPKPVPNPAEFEQRRCETDTGVPLDPADVVAAVLIGQVRRVVFDSAGVVINLGRSRRVFTGGARDAVLLQHRRCLWPGCGLPARRSQIDHITPGDPRPAGRPMPPTGRHCAAVTTAGRTAAIAPGGPRRPLASHPTRRQRDDDADHDLRCRRRLSPASRPCGVPRRRRQAAVCRRSVSRTRPRRPGWARRRGRRGRGGPRRR